MDFSIIPIFLLFIITLMSAVVSTFTTAYFVKKKLKATSEIYLYQGFYIIIGAVVLFALGGFRFEISWYSVLLGIVFGLLTMGGGFLIAYANNIGPIGYTSVINNFSIAITALSGWIVFGESISAIKLIGIAFILVCFVLTVDTSKNNGSSANVKWFIVCLVSLLFTAGIGILQKVHQSSEYKSELLSFLIVAFFVDAISSFLMYAITSEKERKSISKNEQVNFKTTFNKLFILFVVIVGICVALNNVLNLYLSGVVDTAIFFPIVNGVPLMATLLFSFIFFKEKLTKKQAVGLIIGLIAIVFLTI